MGNFKIGVIVDSFRQGFAKGVETAARLGIEGVQMYLVDGEMKPENLNAAKILETKKTLTDNKVEIAAVCGDLGGGGFQVRGDNLRKIERSKLILEKACELGASVVTTHIGVIPTDDKLERYEILREACFELGSFADSLGMSFAIETGPETAPVLKKFLDSLNCKGMKVNLDPANFVMVTGQDPVEAVHILKDYIIHTHAKDGRRLRNVGPEVIYNHFSEETIGDESWGEYFLETPLGEGDVDFDAYFAALKEIGFFGYLTIEREVGENPEADIMKAVKLIRSKI